MLKIIHTADWHIGKMLHRQSLYREISLFLDWLEAEIKNRDTDLLLVSGDIFDLANPSNIDTKLYYDFLHKILKTGITVVITGGNHDSVSLLNAPSVLLKNMGVHVVGGLPDKLEEAVIPVYDKKGSMACIVLAVPFLREKDIRNAGSIDEIPDKTKALPSAVYSIYEHMTAEARTKFGEDVPIIGMGHLYMQGSVTSDSERDIHIGNLSGVGIEYIPDTIDYLALGHIHKPQRVDKNNRIRYSGAPVYLDFSEVGYDKKIIEIEIQNGSISNIEAVPVPLFRELVTMRGTLDEVKNKLSSYVSPGILTSFASIEVTEPTYNSHQIDLLEELAMTEHTQCIIVKSRIHFSDKAGPNLTSEQVEQIEEISPGQMLEMRLESENLDENLKAKMAEAYKEIVDTILHNEGNQ